MNKTFPPLPPFWPELLFYGELDSSNAELRRLDDQKGTHHGTTVVTQYQLAGKGQQGNSWEGNPGENLYLSLFLTPNINAQDQFLFNMRISVLIAEALNKFASGVQIKWPNDIILNNKKIGGLLVENSLSGNKISKSIVGIGINVNQTTYDSLPNASSIRIETGMVISLEALRESILEHLALQLCKGAMADEIVKSYHDLLWKYNEKTLFEAEGTEFEARVLGCDEFGRLLLQNETGVQQFNVKEITWKSW